MDLLPPRSIRLISLSLASLSPSTALVRTPLTSWMVQGVEKCSTSYVADTWYDFAYDIDLRHPRLFLLTTNHNPMTSWQVSTWMLAHVLFNGMDIYLSLQGVATHVPAKRAGL